MSQLYIIVLNYKNFGDTIECAESVLLNKSKDCCLVIVENDSQNGSIDELIAWASEDRQVTLCGDVIDKQTTLAKSEKDFVLLSEGEVGEIYGGVNKRIVFIQSKRNRGYAGGNNLGLKFAMAQADMRFAWILNNDTAIFPGTVDKLVSKLQAYDKKENGHGFYGLHEHYYFDPWSPRVSYLRLNPYLITSTMVILQKEDTILEPGLNAPSGATMLISRDFLMDVGLLSEEYFLYYEELDWSQAARDKGYKLVIFEEYILHKEGASIGTSIDSQKRSKLSDFFGARNRVRFCIKFYPMATPLVLLSFGIVILNRILRRQFDRIPLILGAVAAAFSKVKPPIS